MGVDSDADDPLKLIDDCCVKSKQLSVTCPHELLQTPVTAHIMHDNAAVLQWEESLLHFKVRVSTETWRYPSRARWSSVMISVTLSAWIITAGALPDFHFRISDPPPPFIFFLSCFFSCSSATLSSDAPSSCIFIYRSQLIIMQMPSPSDLWDWHFHLNSLEGLDCLTSSVKV